MTPRQQWIVLAIALTTLAIAAWVIFTACTSSFSPNACKELII